MTEPISVLIVEDHPAMRLVLRRLLETDSQFSVAGVAEDGTAVVDQLAICDPDVLLIDFRLPHVTGEVVAASVLDSNPHAVIVGMSSDEANRETFLKVGATAFFHKDDGLAVLADTLVDAAS